MRSADFFFIFYLEEIQSDLKQGSTDFAKEVEKRLSNGETFDARLSRIKRDFESTFKTALQSEYVKVCTVNLLYSLYESVATG